MGEEGEVMGEEGRRRESLVRWRLERRRQLSEDTSPATCNLQMGKTSDCATRQKS